MLGQLHGDSIAKRPETTRLLNESLEKYYSRIYGPTCDGFDCVISNCILPALRVNDWIIWRDMGAYTVACGTDFNGIPMPDVYFYIMENDLAIIRRLSPDYLLDEHTVATPVKVEPLPVENGNGYTSDDTSVPSEGC